MDRATFEQHHELFYDYRPWPARTRMSLCAQTGHPDKGRRGPWQTLASVDILDVDLMWTTFEQDQAKHANATEFGRSSHIGVGGVRPGVLGRGKREDVVGFPAFIADLDWREGVHAVGDRNPTREEVHTWIDEMPIKPTITYATGGGAHVWMRAPLGLVQGTSDDFYSALRAWKAWWVDLSKRTGRSIDAPVLGDITRAMRAPGTINPNQARDGVAPTVTVIEEHTHWTRDLSFSILANEFKLKVPELRRRTIDFASNVEKRQGALGRAAADSPGTQFARAVPADSFLVWCAEAEYTEGGGISTLNRETGEFSSDPSIGTYTDDDGITRVTVFGTRAHGEWGVARAERVGEAGAEMQASLSSFDLLALLFTDGYDYSAAARIVRHYAADHYEPLLKLLGELDYHEWGTCPEALRSIAKKKLAIPHVLPCAPPPRVDAVPLDPDGAIRSVDVRAIELPTTRWRSTSIHDIPLPKEAA